MRPWRVLAVFGSFIIGCTGSTPHEHGARSGCVNVDGDIGAARGALITPPTECSACNPECRVATDYPSDGDLGSGNSMDVEFDPSAGGIVISPDPSATPPPPPPPAGCDLYAVLPRGATPQTVAVSGTLGAPAASVSIVPSNPAATPEDESAFVTAIAPTTCPCAPGASGPLCNGCGAASTVGFTLTLENHIAVATATLQRFRFRVSMVADSTVVVRPWLCIDVPPITDPMMCTSYGLSCVTDGDCCSGVCATVPGRTFSVCSSLGGTCLGHGAACSVTADCCDGACASGTCDSAATCTAYMSGCSSNGQCCSGLCTMGTCQYPGTSSCLPGNAACTADSQCCSGNCRRNGRCQSGSAPGPACLATGEPCASGSDCCSTSCVSGRCDNLSFCRADGEPCSGDDQCCGLTCNGGICQSAVDECLPRYMPCDRGSECCGRRCSDDGTGVDRCLPLGGCYVAGSTPSQAFGEVCPSAAYCCSGDCRADPSGDMRCYMVRGTGCSTPTMCVGDGEQCNNDCQCCSGDCLRLGTATTHSRCSGAAGMCRMDGELCALDEDCCGGTCQLHPDLMWRCGAPPPPSGGGLFPTGTYTRTYDSTTTCMIPPERPTWGQFRWTATVPAGTSITFEFRTADSTAGLGAAAPVSVTVPTATSPVDVGALLLAAGQRDNLAYLRVTAILTASADLTTSPVLTGFEQEFVCAPVE